MGAVSRDHPCPSSAKAEEFYRDLVDHIRRTEDHQEEGCARCAQLDSIIDMLAYKCRARGCTESSCVLEVASGVA